MREAHGMAGVRGWVNAVTASRKVAGNPLGAGDGKVASRETRQREGVTGVDQPGGRQSARERERERERETHTLTAEHRSSKHMRVGGGKTKKSSTDAMEAVPMWGRREAGGGQRKTSVEGTRTEREREREREREAL